MGEVFSSHVKMVNCGTMRCDLAAVSDARNGEIGGVAAISEPERGSDALLLALPLFGAEVSGEDRRIGRGIVLSRLYGIALSAGLNGFILRSGEIFRDLVTEGGGEFFGRLLRIMLGGAFDGKSLPTEGLGAYTFVLPEEGERVRLFVAVAHSEKMEEYALRHRYRKEERPFPSDLSPEEREAAIVESRSLLLDGEEARALARGLEELMQFGFGAEMFDAFFGKIQDSGREEDGLFRPMVYSGALLGESDREPVAATPLTRKACSRGIAEFFDRDFVFALYLSEPEGSSGARRRSVGNRGVLAFVDTGEEHPKGALFRVLDLLESGWSGIDLTAEVVETGIETGIALLPFAGGPPWNPRNGRRIKIGEAQAILKTPFLSIAVGVRGPDGFFQGDSRKGEVVDGAVTKANRDTRVTVGPLGSEEYFDSLVGRGADLIPFHLREDSLDYSATLRSVTARRISALEPLEEEERRALERGVSVISSGAIVLADPESGNGAGRVYADLFGAEGYRGISLGFTLCGFSGGTDGFFRFLRGLESPGSRKAKETK